MWITTILLETFGPPFYYLLFYIIFIYAKNTRGLKRDQLSHSYNYPILLPFQIQTLCIQARGSNVVCNSFCAQRFKSHFLN